MDTSIEIHLSETCNLNCSCCSHFAQLAEDEYLKPSDFEKSLSAISDDVLNGFRIMRLMGGEPLLNKDVNEIIGIARKYFHKKLELVTNGLLLGKQDTSLFRKCIENDVEIKVTKYPIDFCYDKLVRNLNVMFPKLKIDYYRTDGTMNHFKIDVRGGQDYEKNYKTCYIIKEVHCTQLVGTKLYACSLGAHIRHFNKRFGYDLSDDEYLDLATVKDVSEVEDWYGKSKKFCCYCDLENMKNYPWAQYKKVNGEYVNEYE